MTSVETVHFVYFYLENIHHLLIKYDQIVIVKCVKCYFAQLSTVT